LLRHFDTNSAIDEYSLLAKTAEQWKAACTKWSTRGGAKQIASEWWSSGRSDWIEIACMRDTWNKRNNKRRYVQKVASAIQQISSKFNYTRQTSSIGEIRSIVFSCCYNCYIVVNCFIIVEIKM